MRISLLFMALLMFDAGATVQSENRPHVYVKHAELLTRYPPVARFARLQGTVVLKLRVAGDGKVSAAAASTPDEILNQHPLLQSVSTELVRKWTFGCFNCAESESFEHEITFVYKLEGEPKSYDDTRVVLDLPSEVTLTVSPPQCDHCPSPNKQKTKGRMIP